VATLTFNPPTAGSTPLIDPAGGFAYFGTGDTPAKVIKVRLSDFSEVGRLTLNAGENYPNAATIDTSAGFAYFVTDTVPGIIKIRLSDLTRVATLNLKPGEDGIVRATIDTTHGYAYFAGADAPGVIVKVRLSDFTEVGALTLNENYPSSAVIDPAGGYAYFGTNTTPSAIVKVRLSDFSEVGAITGINPGSSGFGLEGSAIDATRGYAYFVGANFGGNVFRLRLSDFTITGTLTLNPNEQGRLIAIDTAAAFLYLAPNNMGAVIKFDISGPLVQPIDDPATFVYNHYYDFLSRYPDQTGWDYWTSQITQCGADPNCLHNKRVDVSDAFFYELEYQQTGAYVYRLFRAAYGNTQPCPNPDASNPAEANKLPCFAAYANLRQSVIEGSDLSTGQQNAANTFVNEAAFIFKYPAGLTISQFVDAVLQTINNDIGVDLSSQRGPLAALGSRAAVMYRLANDDLAGGNAGVNNRPFIDAEYNRAFVTSQYFGYLRRDGDIPGLLFWLGQLNSAPLRDVTKQHAMVCSFITSAEYQNRFSPLVTHTNQECPQ
jgi:hypothetical protein